MYQYQAYTLDKKLVEGTIDASSEDMAEEYLRRAGYHHVLTLKKTTPPFRFTRLFRWSHRVNKTDIIELFQQLATLIDSRMPVVQALSLLAEQSPQAELKEIINKLGQKLSGGSSLSQALSWYPRLVPAHYREVIRVSEQTGNIPLGLRLVAGYIEKETAVTKNLSRTLSYPAFLVVMATIVISVIAIVALPSLTNLFTSLGATLPLATRILIGLTSFVSHDKYYLVLGLAALVLSVIYYVKSATGKRWLDKTSLKLPVIGPVVVLRNICRFCRNTAMLQEAGLTLPQSLNSVLGVIDNGIIKGALEEIRQNLIKGKGLSQPMAENPVFPKLLVDMVYIGEKTGTLQSSFSTMADFYEKKLDQKLQRLLAMVEPASIIIVGLIISFIGLSIITPIYSIYRTLH
ncbi:MAG: type II secretion system F family protein [Dehalococcoidales bacterium]